MASIKVKSALSKLVAQQVGELKAFAISYANIKVNEYIEYLKQQCPPPEVLKSMTLGVDKVNSVMNTVDKKVDVFKKLPPKLEPILTAAGLVVELILSDPLPVGTRPSGLVQRQADIARFLNELIGAVEEDISAINSIIQQSTGVFEPIKSKIQIIESILYRCAEEEFNNLSQEERANLIDSIQGKTTDPTLNIEQYTSSNGKTYRLQVLIDESILNITPRRYAIAKDNRGIIVLQGPKSFASSEQILKDELKFRIDNQLP